MSPIQVYSVDTKMISKRWKQGETRIDRGVYMPHLDNCQNGAQATILCP